MPSTRCVPMPEIKTRDVVQGTIKTVDRSALAGQRMKDVYVRAKEKAEHSVQSPEETSEEYATNQIGESTEIVAREAVHQVGVMRNKVLHHKRQARQQTSQSPPNTQSEFHATSNPPTAQQPHQANPDGAAPVNEIRFRLGKAEKPVSAQAAQPMPQRLHELAPKTIKTVGGTSETMKQPARSAGVISIKAPGRTIKTAGPTVKTAEHMGGTAIKSTQVTSETARKVAIETARTTQKARVAAKAAGTFARKAAKHTARAVRATVQAMQELLSALAAGGIVLVLLVVLVVMGFAGIMFGSDENDTEIIPVSEEVKAYEPIIQKYAKEHGVGEYVLLIEAVMMQESGGRGTDPMQCSECNFNTLYPHAPGSITDPEYSINVGIQNLADCLQIAGCESPVDMDAIKLALQGYNYGQGYITWAMNKYGEYSKANAIEFSMKTADQYGWGSYGDMDYVPHVLRYYPLGQLFYDPDTSQLIVEVAASQIGNVGGESYWRWYGFTEHVEWCACFVSWCANQCGYLDSIVPKYAGCAAGVLWFKERNQWADRSITPEPGMIIFFDWDENGVSDHTGIVEKVENGRVYTIEGNTSDSVRERSYALGYPGILGYGVPDF